MNHSNEDKVELAQGVSFDNEENKDDTLITFDYRNTSNTI